MIKQSANRVIGLLCVIMLLMGCMVQPAMAEQRFSDTAQHKYEQAINILAAMGVVEGEPDGSFKPDELVTRAEIITMILRAADLADYVGSSSSSPFTDTVGHWAEQNIAFAQTLGYVSGNGDGTFEPDANVTFEQAVKMVINMIDYGFVAEQNGGYPMGYISVAASNSVTDGIDSSIGAELSRAAVAQLIYNAMQTPMLVQNNWGDSASYQKGTENDTLIAKFTLNTDGYGIVSKVGYTATDSVVGTGYSDMVEIAVGEKRYLMNVGNTNAQTLLGREVDFLAVSDRRDREKYTLIYIEETENSKTLKLPAQDIESADPVKMQYTCYLEQTDKLKTVKLDEQFRVIYNNQYVEEPTEADMLPENGYVLLVENNGSTGYDVVFVYDFNNMIVSSSKVEEDVISIYFKSGSIAPIGKIEIDPDDSDSTVMVYSDGEYIDYNTLLGTSVAKWTVASVARSKSLEVTEVHLSTKAVSGTVDGKLDDEEEQYSINGEWYSVAPEFTEGLKIGEDYTVVVNFNNEIVAINTDASNVKNNYALLLKSAIDGTGLQEKTAKFKMILADGTTVEKQGTEKIKINNGTAKKLTVEDLSELADNSLILFTENGEGKISAIETADDSNVCMTTNGYIDFGDENVFTLNASTDLYYKNSSPATLGGDVKVDNSTLVFDVSSADEEEWGAGDITLFSNETVYNVDIYDIDKYKRAKVVVNHGPTLEQDSLVPWSNAPVVIREIYTKLDEDNKAVKVLSGMQNGSEFEMKLKDSKVCDEERENYLADLKPGSVVQVKTNMLGEIVSIRKLYRAPTKTEVFETLGSKNWQGTDYSVKLHTGYGMCVDIDEDIMTVAYRLDNKVSAYSISLANIYVFDTKKQTLEKGDITDAKPASAYGFDDCTRVFLRMEKDDVKDIVIFN